MKFDKLVRDKIPESIVKSGQKPKIHIATEVEYRQKLKLKLQEEVNEYLKDNNIKELADIIEVVYAIADFNKLKPEDLELMRLKKLREKGGFEKRIILEEIK